MDSLEPCDVSMRTQNLTLGPYTLPFGIIRVAVVIEENGRFLAEIHVRKGLTYATVIKLKAYQPKCWQ